MVKNKKLFEIIRIDVDGTIIKEYIVATSKRMLNNIIEGEIIKVTEINIDIPSKNELRDILSEHFDAKVVEYILGSLY